MSSKIKVGLQLSIGGLGDQSFNDSAFAGLEEAKRLYDIDFETAEWQDWPEHIDAMEKWTGANFDLIVAIGFLNAPAISEAATIYPDMRFAIIDYAGAGDNVWSAVYREYEGDFVVGALAALVTKTHTVGFMGGGVTPIVRRIELGFGEGVMHIDPTISVISDYVGEFDDEYKGRILAETQFSLGADVIYQVAGRCGLGAIRAAKKFDTYIISTGGDHSHLAPENVLTSRIKDVGKPIIDIIAATVEGRFEGGVTKSYGFAEGGLSMAPIRPEISNIINPEIEKKIREIQAKVISGEIEVSLESEEEIVAG